ncbi:MAG: Ada metal-binding domain-containing protein [Gammaproteobacteria bacterium]|nr:Ada metal-binding domain-containing protein [Gammaproteobacteria bacterium]
MRGCGIIPLMDTHAAIDPEACWAAVRDRDARAGGFVYAVLSTGVVCRPGCAAPRPRREQVLFYPTLAAAQAAGFRPCRRCRPGTDPVPVWLEPACRALEAGDAAVGEVAAGLGLGRSTLHRGFVRHLGLAPGDYRAAVRGQRLRTALTLPGSVTEAGLEAGFASPSAAWEAARDSLGMAPGRYRRGGEGLELGWIAADTALGPMVAAATGEGLCLVEFLDTQAAADLQVEAECRVRDRFPRARLRPADGDSRALLQTVLGRIELPEAGETLPLDIIGTAFQRRVWMLLRELGWGERVSIFGTGTAAGAPRRQPGRGPGLWRESTGGAGALPPGGGGGRRPARLSLGTGAQAEAAGARSAGRRTRRREAETVTGPSGCPFLLWVKGSPCPSRHQSGRASISPSGPTRCTSRRRPLRGPGTGCRARIRWRRRPCTGSSCGSSAGPRGRRPCPCDRRWRHSPRSPAPWRWGRPW